MRRIVTIMAWMAVLAAAGSWAAEPSIKVGLLAPVSGFTPEWGKNQVVAAEMARDEINLRGGVNGLPLEIVFCDTGGHPGAREQLFSAYERLCEEVGVVAVVGPFFSFECQALFPLTNDHGVAVIGTASSKPGLCDLTRYPYAFRMTVTEDKMARVQLKNWVEAFSIRDVAIIHDEKDPTGSVMGTRVWPGVLKELGVSLLSEADPITFRTGDPEIPGLGDRLRALEPGGICISAIGSDAGRIARAIREAGLRQPLIGHNQASNDLFIESAGPAAEGFWGVGLFYANDPNPAVQRYAEAFRKRCPKHYADIPCSPEQFDVVVYDTIHFLSDILKRKGLGRDPARLQEDRRALRDGLARMGVWRGTAGMMAFDGKGDGVRTIHILEVRDGRWQPVR